MQKLYTSNDMARDTGCSKATIGLWVSKNWVKTCRMTGTKCIEHDRFFTQEEHDRIMEAVRAAEGHPRKIYLFLNRTLHEARDYSAVNCPELATRCGCCETTVRKALVRLGYPKNRNVAVLEEDIGEVKAVVQKFREEGQEKRAAAMKSIVRNPVVSNPESATKITLHIKGLTITLDRKDAEALAEEIISQI